MVRAVLIVGCLWLLGCAAVPAPTPTATSTRVSATATSPPETLRPTSEPPTATPPPLPTATSTPPPTVPTDEAGSSVYLPVLQSAAASPTATPRPSATPTPTPIPTVDFAAVRSALAQQGQALAFSKIGFHVSVGGQRTDLSAWMRRQTEAGAPFFLKSVSDAGVLVEAQTLRRESGVPHTLVFRVSGDEYDTPNYELPPREAAQAHWALHTAAWPPELDRELVWFETLNEVDKNRSVWLAQFALETAQLALRDGIKWAAFGWSSGEPENEHWQSPEMLAFLRLAGQYPEQLAVALHEYSYIVDDITDQYPYKIGRFQFLFQLCDQYGLPRPTVLITEWGWEYRDVPEVDQALRDVAWAAQLYAAYPQVKGAAIWYLGPGYGDIDVQTQRLITPLMVYNLTHYFPISAGPTAVDFEQFRR